MKSVVVSALLLLMAVINVSHAAGDTAGGAPAQSQQLAFKEASSPAVSVPAIVGVTLGMLVVAVGLIFLIKRYSPGLQSLRVRGERRLKLIEAIRVSPKSAIFLVECDGRNYLLAQCDDQLVVLNDNQRPAANPAVPPEVMQ